MKNFKKYFQIPAEPVLVYQALTNAATIQLWTGEKAIMSTIPGSEFALWEDSIEGKNISFEENKKIVQQWYFGDQPEESIVTIILHENKKGTSLELLHTNIPDEAFDDIVEGWNEAYMGGLIEFYKEEE
ncbi:SRPBCC domain-containing protein [Limnovirga soli]|uniref:ATPase n=1 Tax=Limnovirga soli TaxID=2656915 RepID=A0A8J8JQ35_9BACT|nr:SRPBCC domain-containing protein [Limnovirga soli]NNV54302.1 ATPase [Limnovirga soli]